MFDFEMPSLEWRVCEIPKPNKPGEFRKLTIPNYDLLVLQERLYQYLKGLKRPRPAPYAHGFVPYRNTISAVMALDPKADVILGMDAKDFFDTFPVANVREALRASDELTENDIDRILTACTYKNTLPQGAPTSPWLTNIGMRDVDCMLNAYALRKGFKYVRYADDIFMSTYLPPGEPRPKKGHFLPIFYGVETLLKKTLGIRLHWSKSHVIYRDGSTHCEVLGIVLAHDRKGLNAPNKMRRNARAGVCALATKIEKNGGRVFPEDRARWRELLGYVRYFDNIRAAGEERNGADTFIQERYWNVLCDAFGVSGKEQD